MNLNGTLFTVCSLYLEGKLRMRCQCFEYMMYDSASFLPWSDIIIISEMIFKDVLRIHFFASFYFSVRRKL